MLIATQAGAKAQIDLMQVMRNRLILTGSTLRPRTADEKARLAAAVEARVWPWIEAGKIKPDGRQDLPSDPSRRRPRPRRKRRARRQGGV